MTPGQIFEAASKMDATILINLSHTGKYYGFNYQICLFPDQTLGAGEWEIFSKGTHKRLGAGAVHEDVLSDPTDPDFMQAHQDEFQKIINTFDKPKNRVTPNARKSGVRWL